MRLNRRFDSWIASLLLIPLCLSFSCSRVPESTAVVDGEDVIATLFKVDGVVANERIQGLRAYLLVNSRNEFVLTLMTAMNSQLATIYYNGRSSVLVDYRNRTAYRDLHPPFDFQGVLQFKVDLRELVQFYRNAYLKGIPSRNRYDWGVAYLNERGDLVGMLEDGSRLLLSPVDPPTRKQMELPRLQIPEGYRVLDEISHSGLRED